jgi:hypothetical protein
MLIRMVHVRPSLGPIPQPRQPRTLIRVPKMAPMLWEPSAVPSDGPATTPSAPPWRLRRLDHVCEARRDRDLPGHVSHDRRAGRAATPGARPFIRDRLQRWKLRPRLDAGMATTAPTWRSRTWSRCLLPCTAIFQGILVPMRGASVLRPSTQALDGVPCPPASRLGPPLAARLRLTLHSGPSPGDWPVRLLRDSSGWGGHAGRRSGSCPARPCATLRPVRQRAAPLAKRLTQSKACPPRAMGQTPCVFIALAG